MVAAMAGRNGEQGMDNRGTKWITGARGRWFVIGTKPKVSPCWLSWMGDGNVRQPTICFKELNWLVCPKGPI